MASGAAPVGANSIAPQRSLGLYERCTVIAAVAYLALPLFVMYPPIFEAVTAIPALEGTRLANFRSLMTVVTPIGLIYLFAVFNRLTSLVDLTVVWRLAWVGPWLLLNYLTGAIEGTAALAIAALDVGMPIASLALDANGRGAFGRLAAHFTAKTTGTFAQRVLKVEAPLGFVASAATSVYLLTRPEHAYVESFVVSVVGLYYLFLAWAAKQEGAPTLLFALGIRAVLLAALVGCASYGFARGPCIGFATAAGFGIYLHGYTALWERQVRGAPQWSVARWIAIAAIGVMALSVIWAAAAPWYSATCTQLAVNIHRQDLIIGSFAILVGVLLLDVKEKSPVHVAVISWLLPLSALWFTLDTKLLCNLDVGTPFHPSWIARGLAPRYAESIAVDLTFSLATIFMTAISTNYVALVLLRYLPREGWRSLSWHGIAVIALSALWMIAASSGIPAPVSGLPAIATVPPIIPVDPVAAVAVHIRDLLVGIVLIAVGLLLDKRAPDAAHAARWVAVGAWAVFLLPKVYLHLHI